MASYGLSQNSKVFSDALNQCKSSVRLRSSSSDTTVYTAPDGRLSTFSRVLKTPLENSTLMLIACFSTFYITLPVAKKPRCRLANSRRNISATAIGWAPYLGLRLQSRHLHRVRF